MNKKIIISSIILILTFNGFSQSIDNIVNQRISDSLKTLPADTIKPFSITGNLVIFPDTITIPVNTMYQIELGILYRNTTTGVILTGNKIVTIQRNGSGIYNIVYDPAPSGNITKTQWTLGIVNGFLLIRLTGVAGVITKGVISKYYKLMSSQ